MKRQPLLLAMSALLIFSLLTPLQAFAASAPPGPQKSFSAGQKVAAKDHNGKWYEAIYLVYDKDWGHDVEVKTGSTTRGFNVQYDADIMTLDEAKTKGILLENPSASGGTPPPANPPPANPPPASNPNRFTAGQEVIGKQPNGKYYRGTYVSSNGNWHQIKYSTANGSGSFYAADADVMTPGEALAKGIKPPFANEILPKYSGLIFANKNGQWQQAQVQGPPRDAGNETEYHVQYRDGTTEVIKESANRLATFDEALQKNYWQLPKDRIIPGAASAAYKQIGYASGVAGNMAEFVSVYLGNFTANNAPNQESGKDIVYRDAPLIRALVEETNRVRQNPKAYAAELEAKLKDAYDWSYFEDIINTIAYLKEVKAVGALSYVQGASQANRDLIAYHQEAGSHHGHTGKNGSGPAQRVQVYGTFQGGMGENIGYDSRSNLPTSDQEIRMLAKKIIEQLVVDPGANNRVRRGHRVTIFDGQAMPGQS